VALTPKQQAFVEAYTGNATEAARVAGYRGGDAACAVMGSQLLRNPKVRAAIDARQAPAKGARIASREERQAFWTATMEDRQLKYEVRLKASELLGKSNADFTDRVQHEGSVTINVIDPYAKSKPGGS
jgi:phage terminase small subunit